MPVESALRRRPDRPIGLIETLRYEPGQGCIRASRHLARMAASAQLLGKKFDYDDAGRKLAAMQSNTSLRLRLLLGEDDMLTLTSHPFTPVSQGNIWSVAIANTKLDSADTLLAHKTTLRQHYEAARAEFDTNDIDEVLLTNQHGHVCEGTITSVFVQRGEILITPPLADGLLRGVLRQELLDNGNAKEGTVEIEDLHSATFFVGNSLRGLIPAVLHRTIT
jgi:4-amino-4-deoxychorismate lyase